MASKQKKDGFLNESTLTFNDISAEKVRQYTFPNGKKLVLHNPLWLNVSASGGHRVYCKGGTSYYIQPKEGWSISWKVKNGNPNFVK